MDIPLVLALVMTVWTVAAKVLEPHEHVVEVGTRFMVPCLSPTGGNTSDLVWMENGVKLVTGKRYTISANEPHGSILILDRVELSDNGTILSCSETSGSSASILFSVRLIILAPDEVPRGFPPMIDSGASGSRVRYPYSGDVVRLPCYAHGNPKPYIMWFKDSVPINRNDKRYLIATSNDLFIRNAQPEDSGIYACAALNVHGMSVSIPFEVHVLEQGTVKVLPAIFYTTLFCCLMIVWVILVAVVVLLRRAHSRRYARTRPHANRPNRRVVIAGPPPDYDSVVRMNEAVSVDCM